MAKTQLVAALVLAALSCQAREECEDGLQRAIRESAGKLKWQEGEAKERGAYLIKRHAELTDLLDTSAKELINLVNKKGMPWAYRIVERLGGEVKEAEKIKPDNVQGQLQKAESYAKGAIPGLKSYADGLIGQLNKAREMVAALGAKGKALVLVMSKGLEHEPNEASKGRSSATNLRDVKAKVAREHPKLDKLGFEILDLLGNLTEKMGPFARSGRGHSIKVTTVLNNCIEKLEGKEDTGELRSELQDHENSIWEDDVRLHSEAEKIAQQIVKGRDIMNDIQTYSMRYSGDFNKWTAKDIERMEQIEELRKK